MPSEAELERLVVKVNGDASGYRKAMEDVRSQTNMTDGHIQLATRRISAFGLQLRGYGVNAAAAVLPLVGAAGLVGSAWKGIGLAAEFEKNESAFGTMLQSAEKGKFLMREIAQLAAETPMNQRDLQAGAKMLLQFGENAKSIVPSLRMMGDIAGGDASLMQRLSLAYGQVRGVGHVQGDELNQMLEAGFNPLREMARTKAGGAQGKMEGAAFEGALAELQKLKEQGGITFKMLKDAFKSATNEGGQFFGGMERASKTLSGLFSTMQDDVDTALREMGQSLVDNLNLKDFVKEVSKNAQAVSEWFASINPHIKRMAAAVGVATAAFVAFAATLAVTSIAIKVISAGIGVWTASLLSLVGFGIAFGTIWVMRVGSVQEAFQKAKKAVKEFVDANYDLIVRSALAAAAVYAFVSAVRILFGLFTMLKAVLVALHVQQIAMTALWVVWKVAIFAVAAAFTILKFVLVSLSIALTAVNVLVSAGAFAGAIGAIGGLIFAYAALKGTVMGLVGASRALYDVFKTTDTLAGPVAHVRDLFGEWYAIIKKVLYALTVDSKMAMNLLKAGFQLMVAQLTESLPPLWKFMRNGFETVAEYVASVFRAEFKATMNDVNDDIAMSLGRIDEKEQAAHKEGMRKTLEAEKAMARTILDLKMGAAKHAFEKARKVGDGQEVKDAREKTQKIMDEIDRTAHDQAVANQPALWGFGKMIFKGLEVAADEAEKQMQKTKQTLASFSGQSLVGSAADRLKLQEALLASVELRGIRANEPPTFRSPNGPGFTNPVAGPERAVAILDEMLGIMRKNDKPAVALMPAAIAGGAY